MIVRSSCASRRFGQNLCVFFSFNFSRIFDLGTRARKKFFSREKFCEIFLFKYRILELLMLLSIKFVICIYIYGDLVRVKLVLLSLVEQSCEYNFIG